jgi:GTPase SAR1 family protein
MQEMENFSQTKQALTEIAQGLASLFSSAGSIPGMADHPFSDWEKTCGSIRDQLTRERLRVAVVGPIKSGKSSFANALLGGDYLKRGAGVVTSIVTRVRCGETLRADLFFKTWDEVNADMQQALVLLPSLKHESATGEFDIRRSQDREDLKEALGRLDAELLFSGSTRNASSVLLSSYLNGYDRVRDKMGADHQTVRYTGENVAAHREFVGDDNLAVYLRDISLTIDSDRIDGGIEIADCQGSDSPNPLHLAMIQDYLLLTHLTVYVISSRTGLRQADIRFLSMIRKMGIMDNLIFVINVDFSEHNGLDDLTGLIRKIKEELSLIKPDPEVYPLSALFNLFQATADRLAPREKLRLDQWVADGDMAAYSQGQTRAFHQAFAHRLTEERSALLLQNHVARLAVVAAGTVQWMKLSQDLLGQNAAGAGEVIGKIRQHQEKLERIKAIIRNTLDGAVQKLVRELKTEVDGFFDHRSGSVLAGALSFIHDHPVAFENYHENLEKSGFNNTLYLVFQEFRTALDGFMAESVNPEIIRFSRRQEKRIREYLEAVAGPYAAMAADALAEYSDAMAGYGLAAAGAGAEKIRLPEMDTLRSMAGISLPPATATMRFSARIKSEAVLRLGFYSVVKMFKKLLKKPPTGEREEKMAALADGMVRIRRETENSMQFHFKSYRENFKFQYLVKLVDAASASLYEAMNDRFQAYVTDLSNLSGLMDREEAARAKIRETLGEMEDRAGDMVMRIERIRENLERRSLL